MPIQPKQQPPYYTPTTTPTVLISKTKSQVIEYTTVGLHPYLEYTIPANTITQSGQGIKIQLYVNFVTVTTGTSEIYLKWNGDTILAPAMSGLGLNSLIVTILYDTNTTAIQLAEGYSGASLLRQYALLSGRDWTVDNTLVIGVNNGSGHITQALAAIANNIFSTQ